MKRAMNRAMTWGNRAGSALFTAFVEAAVVLSHPFILGRDRLARLAISTL